MEIQEKILTQNTEKKERFCRICGKKLYSQRTNSHCSLECLAKEPGLLETAKNLEISTRKLAKIFNVPREKLIKVLDDSEIRKSSLAEKRTKTCPACNTIFFAHKSDQKCCSVSCGCKIRSGPYRTKSKEELLAIDRNERAKRRALKKQAETDTANKKILILIYKHVPEGYHVDHIIPINKGGLHHQDNLQYLPASENSRKKDRLDYEPQGVIRWQDIIELTEN